MPGDLVTGVLRARFKEFLSAYFKLAEIRAHFDSAGIAADSEFAPPDNGERRRLVEQYYHSLDCADPSDARRLLQAYASLLSAGDQKAFYVLGGFAGESIRGAIDSLVEALRREGFRYEEGQIVPTTPDARRVFEEARIPGHTITPITKRDILEHMGAWWYGDLDEIQFLNRLHDLDALPSGDSRFSTARDDIWKHTVDNPNDWEPDWVFGDERFGLLDGSDEIYLRFLCETIHPLVRRDQEEVVRLLALYNRYLAGDGWEIVEDRRLSGRPIFTWRVRGTPDAPPLAAVKEHAVTLSYEYIRTQCARMESSAESQPDLAIGTAKEFIETVCKTILVEVGSPPAENATVPQLVKLAMASLPLVPADLSKPQRGADATKRLLGALAGTAQAVGELRSLYGTGHGKEASASGLEPRHARLVVNAASTLAVFLFDAYQELKQADDSGDTPPGSS